MIPSLPDLRSAIKEMRHEAELTQAQLAELSDCSQSFIAKLESGRTNPRYADIAHVYNVLEQRLQRSTVTAGQLAQPGIISVVPGDTLSVARRRMKGRGYSQLPVVEDDRCVGQIQSKDIIDADLTSTVKDHMQGPLPEVPQATPKDAVAALVRSAGAVLVRDEELCGIITAADLL